jgi:hypothetical protein
VEKEVRKAPRYPVKVVGSFAVKAFTTAGTQKGQLYTAHFIHGADGTIWRWIEEWDPTWTQNRGMVVGIKGWEEFKAAEVRIAEKWEGGGLIA